MKKYIKPTKILCFFLFIVFSNGCKDKEEKMPLLSAEITDIDGNVYHAVTIGTQVWMVENLKVTRYQNGDAIAQVQGATEWGALNSDAWCYYDNNTDNGPIYGKLYNWYAVNDTRGIAPKGWHVPTQAEWDKLIAYMQIDSSVCAGKLKEAGFFHWKSPNTAANNESGFTAIPGGTRNIDGTFSNIGKCGNWWSATIFSILETSNIKLNYNNKYINYTIALQEEGLSVRCIKD